MKRFLLLIGILIFILLGAYLWVEPATLPVAEEAAAPIYSPPSVLPQEVSIKIFPEAVLQGDPALIVVEGTATVESIRFDGKNLNVFDHDGKPAALVGIDLRGRTGAYPIEVTLADNKKIKQDLIVGTRTIVKAPLGIPDKLGGDTPEAEKELIDTLAREGALISAIIPGEKKLWDGKFRLPLDGNIVVTDTYGYSRLTGASTIAHKGTDYRAAVGTPVYAMNSGTIRFTEYLRNYGHTIIVDHGAGVLGIYMHLSEILVKKGEMVEKGQLVAKSGETGYVLGPHLHLTIRINGISIDPEKFIKLPL